MENISLKNTSNYSVNTSNVISNYVTYTYNKFDIYESNLEYVEHPPRAPDSYGSYVAGTIGNVAYASGTVQKISFYIDGLEYEIGASDNYWTQYSGGIYYYMHHMIDKNLGTVWAGVRNTYFGNWHNYNSTAYLADSNYKGEWFYLKLPNAIQLKSYSFTCLGEAHPMAWKVYGTNNNGATWTEIPEASQITDISYTSGVFVKTLNKPSVKYNTFGFCVNRYTMGGGGYMIFMTELKLYSQIMRNDYNTSNYITNTSNVISNRITSFVQSSWTYNANNIYYTLGKVGIGTTSTESILTINPIVVDRNAFDHSVSPLTITHQTATSTSVLNDPKEILHLCRQGTVSQSHGAKATFKLCRYENSTTTSRTRLDITLAHSSYDDVNIMSIRSDGKVGIGITNPGYMLHVNGDINANGYIRPSAGTGNNGIIFPNDPGGGGADGAWIKYYARSGEACTLELGISNDGDDHIALMPDGNVGIGTNNPASKLHVVGSIIATGNVSAYYSDMRLKTKINDIKEPLKIIEKLNGFYYKANELAKSHGFTEDKIEIGLSAQDVNDVLPEIVSLAPFDSSNISSGDKDILVSKSGNNYLTMSYERLAPVFVEAIKELKNEIRDLKYQLYHITNVINNH